MSKTKGFILILYLLIPIQPVWAQLTLTWDDFCEEYFFADEDNSASAEEQMEILEGYLLNPLNLNQASRADLLNLPFLNHAQVDSILSFRDKKHGFLTLGDLMFIQNLSFSDRRYMSLFVTIGETESRKITLRQQLFGGKHEVETRIDIPLYSRAGQKDYPTEVLQKYPNRKYLGNGLTNVVRYRYNQHQSVRYGITLEKDAGEPFGNRKNYPYDYVSAYILYELPSHKARFIAGDYRLSAGQGLLLGNRFLNSWNMLLDAVIKPVDFFKPHTGTEENKYFRGAAASLFLKKLSISLFASYNRIDARTEEGMVVSLQNTGLHRTLSEIERKNTVGNFSTGGRISYGRSNWEVGITGLYTHYDKELCPDDTPYNKYYLRGKSTAGFSADWWISFRQWTISGEVAADSKFHPAMSQTIAYQPLDELSFSLQHRHFSKKFVSQYGETAQQSSRVANEHGIMIGGKYTGFRKLELRTYADVFFFPDATFLAQQPSKGIELMVEGTYHINQPLTLMLRYKMKTRQQSVTGYREILEYRQTHRLLLAATLQQEKYQLRASLDATVAGRQTASTRWGWASSLRGTYRPRETFSVSASAALFFTDDYDTAVYIYEPRMRHTFSNTALYYHGYRLTALASWRICKWLELSAKYGCLHYFNRKEIGTGSQMIASPTKQDVSVQMLLKF